MKKLFATATALLVIAAFAYKCDHAHAADMPLKALPPIPQIAGSGFYLGANFGAAFSDQQHNFITQAGSASSSLPGKIYPAGTPIGGTLGFGGNLGALYVAAEAELAYDLSKATAQCSFPVNGALTVTTTCGAKPSWLATQGIVLGLAMPTITSTAQRLGVPPASQWPIALTAPSNLSAANIMPFVKLGVAERDANAWVAATNVGGVTLPGVSQRETLFGPLLGGGLSFLVAAGWGVKAEVDWMGFNKQFVSTATSATPLFATGTQFKQVGETRGTVTGTYHF